VPNWILRHPEIGPTAKLVYSAMLSYAWEPRLRQCYAGQSTIAADIRVSVATVKRAMSALRRAGILSTRRRGLGKTSVHVLKWHIDPTVGSICADGGVTGEPSGGVTGEPTEEDTAKNTDQSSTRTTWLTPLFDALSRVCLDAPDDEREAKAWFGWWAREVSRLIKHLAKVNAKQDRPPPDQDAVVLYMAWVAEDVLGGAWPDTFPTAPLKSIRYLCATARGEDTIDRYRSKLRREYRERLDDELAGA